MNWNSASEFFDMGGYGLYVWGAYAVTAALMVAEPLLAARRRRRAWTNATALATSAVSATHSTASLRREQRT
jgi:heme exporter protein D